MLAAPASRTMVIIRLHRLVMIRGRAAVGPESVSRPCPSPPERLCRRLGARPRCCLP